MTTPLVLVGLAAFLIGAVAGAPASLAARIATATAPLLEISGTEGTLWRGAFSGVRYNAIDLGRIDYQLSPLHLLGGRIAGDIAAKGGALNGRAHAVFGPRSIELRDAAADFNLGAIRSYSFFGVRYQGVVSLNAKSLALAKGRCVAEGARLSTNLLDALARQWRAEALPLSGDISCVEGNLAAALSGANREGALAVTATLSPALSYTLDVKAAPKTREIDAVLRQVGFEEDSGRLSLRAAGQLKGLSS